MGLEKLQDKIEVDGLNTIICEDVNAHINAFIGSLASKSNACGNNRLVEF